VQNSKQWILCRKCDRLKPSFDFYKNHRTCKVCQGHLGQKYKGGRSRWRQRRKVEVISHYSDGEMTCAKCGFSDLRALSIDHISGDGANHKRSRKGDLYGWLRKHKYPSGFQVLCMNCQFIKAYENNEHPSRSTPIDKVKGGVAD